ncbi:unnamed protein product, partial [Closterium sp. NIES-53]
PVASAVPSPLLSRRPCCPVAPAVPSRRVCPVASHALRLTVPPRRAIRPVPSRRVALSVRVALPVPSRRVVPDRLVRSRRAARPGFGNSSSHLFASAMASPGVLRFDTEVQADESLWAHASGDLPKPDDPAPLGGDPSSADRDHYARQRADLIAGKSRDAAACITLSSLLPESEEAHFTQVRTASEFLTAIKARYATPTSVSLGRLFLPFLFPDLASFERSVDLIAHLRSLDSSYRAACTDA